MTGDGDVHQHRLYGTRVELKLLTLHAQETHFALLVLPAASDKTTWVGAGGPLPRPPTYRSFQGSVPRVWTPPVKATKGAAVPAKRAPCGLESSAFLTSVDPPLFLEEMLLVVHNMNTSMKTGEGVFRAQQVSVRRASFREHALAAPKHLRGKAPARRRGAR